MSTISLDSQEPFTISKIVCVGRNYTRHIAEMSAHRTKDPVLFLKPPSAIIHAGNPIILPVYSKQIHHEVELALLITRRANRIKKEDWRLYVGGFGVAIDLTLRDLQEKAKNEGLPWSVCKGFDGSCPVSEFVRMDERTDLQNLTLILQVNGQTRQHASTADMIFKIDELLAFITAIFTLEAGDVILTGTPEGVGPLQNGDLVRIGIQDIVSVEFPVTGRAV